MDTLQIIVGIMSALAYGAMAFLAAFAVTRLKRQEEDLRWLKKVAEKTLELVIVGYIQRSFEMLNDMKETLQDLVDDDRFEEAEDMKKTIVKMEHCAIRELERFKEICGDDCVDIKITNIRRD